MTPENGFEGQKSSQVSSDENLGNALQDAASVTGSFVQSLVHNGVINDGELGGPTASNLVDPGI